MGQDNMIYLLRASLELAARQDVVHNTEVKSFDSLVHALLQTMARILSDGQIKFSS